MTAKECSLWRFVIGLRLMPNRVFVLPDPARLMTVKECPSQVVVHFEASTGAVGSSAGPAWSECLLKMGESLY